MNSSGKYRGSYGDYSSQYFIIYSQYSKWSDLTIFDYTMVQKQYTFNRNQSPNSEFCSFPRLVKQGMTPSQCWAEVVSHSFQSGAQHEAKKPILWRALCRQRLFGCCVLHFHWKPIISMKCPVVSLASGEKNRNATAGARPLTTASCPNNASVLSTLRVGLAKLWL